MNIFGLTGFSDPDRGLPLFEFRRNDISDDVRRKGRESFFFFWLLVTLPY